MDKDEYIKYWKEYSTLHKCITRLQINRALSGNIKGRELIAISAYNKLLIQYTSLIKIIPNNDFSAFDKTSISSIGRAIVELSNNLFFYGTESISEDEEDLRISLFNYLSKKDRKATLQKFDAKKSDIISFNLSDEEVKSIRDEICSNPIFVELIKKDIIKGIDSLVQTDSQKNKYLRRSSILMRRGIDEKFIDGFYKMSSIFLHNSPGAIDQHREYLSNYEKYERKDLLTTVSLMQIPSSFIANSILDFSTYTDELENLVEDTEIQLIMKYANIVKKKPASNNA